MTPEQRARQQIDATLNGSGWIIQDYKRLNLGAGKGIAVREVPLASGRCDYLLIVDRKPVGVIEAKKAAAPLSTVADQSGRYAESLPDILAALAPGKLAFVQQNLVMEPSGDRLPKPARMGGAGGSSNSHRAPGLQGWARHDLFRCCTLEPTPLILARDTRLCGGAPLRRRRGRCKLRSVRGSQHHSHAEDIGHLVREVPGRGNDFAKTIIYRAVHAVTGLAIGARLVAQSTFS
ncbi:MAG: hypothetical protein ABI680_02495 [Chthoniobacteraceae bacterium]